MKIEVRMVDGKPTRVKVYAPSRRRAHARVDRVYCAKSGNARAARWVAQENGQFTNTSV